MATYHAAVWLDHSDAKIFNVSKETFDEKVITSPHAHTQLHRRSGSDDGHRADEDQHYYHEVAQALEGAEEILVVGPSTAKLAFVKHVHRHDHALVPRIIGVETVDHPTDGQLVAYVRRYFEAADQVHKG
jgi:stalled ribosome rescue protein Dom34